MLVLWAAWVIAHGLIAQGTLGATLNSDHGLLLTLAPAREAELTQGIPPRPRHAQTGSQFAKSVSTMDARHREQAILSEILGGNLPSFLRRLVPVELANQSVGNEILKATIFVMPEYLAIGSDHDFLRIPVNLETASAIAARFGFVLPTRKMVDAIYEQASFRFVPEPMAPGPQMRSTEYYRIHNEMIDKQSRAGGVLYGELVSGHKKDVVVSNRLAGTPERMAIYGWHRSPGAPIQPLSTVHGVCYADYSHGIRLISEKAFMNGQLRSVPEMLQDAVLSNVLSDEGPIPNVWTLPGHKPGETYCEQGRQGTRREDSSAIYSSVLQQRKPR